MALYIAYSLALQALMTSVGVGMAAAGTDPIGVLCGIAAHHTEAPAGDRQTPSSIPQCPFCFVAAQSAGHIGAAPEAPAFPAYAGLVVATITAPVDGRIFVPPFRHRHGEPRAPPACFV